MNFLDMRTVIFSHVIIDLVCTMVMAFLWLQNRKRFAGIAWWVLDFALQATAMILIVLRGSIPDWISMVLSNTLVMAGALCGYLGLERFVGKTSAQFHNYALLAIFAGVHTYFTVGQPNLAARNFNVSLGLLLLSGQCVWLMFRRVPSDLRSLTRGVGLVFSAYCLISLVRIGKFFTSPHPGNDFFQSSAFETLILLTYQMLFVLLTYSLALMVNSRLIMEIRLQEEKFTKAFHSAPYAIMLTRLTDGKIFEVNDGFVEISGYQAAEVLGKTTTELHLWPQAEDRARFVHLLTQQPSVHEQECQFQKKSGEHLIGLVSAELLTINNQPCVLSSINDISERKRAETAIHALAKFPDENPNPVLRIGRDGMVRYANQGSADLLQAWHCAVGQQLPDRWRQVVLETLEAGVDRDEAAECDARVFALALTPIADGGYVNIYGRDITEIKQAEENLKKSEHKLREAQEMAHLGFWHWDVQTGEVEWSEEVFKIFGRHPQEFTPRIDSILALSPWPEDHLRDQELIKRAIANHEPGSYEQKFLRPDQSIGYYYSTFQGNYAEHGQLISIVGTVLDITERKQAEEALRASEDKFKYVFDYSAVGKSITLPSGEINVNQAFCDMLGYTPDELRHQTWQAITHPDDLELSQHAIDLLRAGEQSSTRFIKRYIHKNGSVVWADVSTALRRDQDGQPLYFMTTVSDITARKHAEAEQERLNVELVRKNKELEHLVYVTSHDLRSPLVNVQGFSKELSLAVRDLIALLQSADVPEHIRETAAGIVANDIQEDLRYILTSIAKMDTLLAGLLKLSRLGRAALTITALDMNALIETVRTTFEFQIQKAGVKLEVAELLSCKGDATQVNQVFSNLIDNALKYLDPTRPGIIQITGSLKDDHAMYCVADNGIGIAPEHQQKIFEVFQRLNPRVGTGEGIGLAAARKLIERQGGTIWVESEPGQGSKFYVSLPKGRME